MFNLMKYINVPIFIAALIFGLFAVYMTTPTDRKIYVYPTPENVDIIQYKDATGTCFNFKQKDVKCPVGDIGVSTVPVQS